MVTAGRDVGSAPVDGGFVGFDSTGPPVVGFTESLLRLKFALNGLAVTIEKVADVIPLLQ